MTPFVFCLFQISTNLSTLTDDGAILPVTLLTNPSQLSVGLRGSIEISSLLWIQLLVTVFLIWPDPCGLFSLCDDTSFLFCLCVIRATSLATWQETCMLKVQRFTADYFNVMSLGHFPYLMKVAYMYISDLMPFHSNYQACDASSFRSTKERYFYLVR